MNKKESMLNRSFKIFDLLDSLRDTTINLRDKELWIMMDNLKQELEDIIERYKIDA